MAPSGKTRHRPLPPLNLQLSARSVANGWLRHVLPLLGAFGVLAALVLTLAVDTKVKLTPRCQLASFQLRIHGA